MSRHEVLAVEIRDPREQELPDVGDALARRPRDRAPGARRHAQPRRCASASPPRRPRSAAGSRACSRALGVPHVRPLDLGRLAAAVRDVPRSGARDELRPPAAARRARRRCRSSCVAVARAQERRRRAQAARFATRGADPEPRRRTAGRAALVPLGLFLVALAALVVGAARPHAHISVPRKEATIVLAVDVSRSMTAQDVRPTRLAAARNAADAFLAKVPKEYSDRRARLRHARVRRRSADDRPRARARRARVAYAERGHRDRRRRRARRADRQEAACRRRLRARRRRCSSSPTARATAAGPRRSPRRARRARRGIPISTVLVGTAAGIVTNKLVGGYEEQIRVPPSPGTLQQIAKLERRHVLPRPHDRGAHRCLQEARDARRPQDAGPPDHRSLRRSARPCSCSRAARSRRSGSGGSCREARARPRSPRLGACASRRAARQRRTSAAACRSACPSPGRGSRRGRGVEFQLSCPPRFIVAGLDAELSAAASTSASSARSAAPSTPGSRRRDAALPRRARPRRLTRADGFRPLIGCVPARGAAAARRRHITPSRPTSHRPRVKTVRVQAGAKTLAIARCPKGQRLVSATHALAFFGSTPPTAANIQGSP